MVGCGSRSQKWSALPNAGKVGKVGKEKENDVRQGQWQDHRS